MVISHIPAASLRVLTRLGRHPVWSSLVIVTLVVVVNVGLTATIRPPIPAVHDEFSYLLGADTLAHGRLANPSHPLWPHFETPHVLPIPTYVSKYPVGQSLALATGQVLTGYPIVGVWLSVAAACLAFYWMLTAWLPERWALLGACLAALHPTMLLWGQMFWGGAVAAFGGALLVGAWRRIWRTPSRRTGAVLGLGLVVLANSRPYEGFVLAAVLTIATAILLRRCGKVERQRLIARVMPAAACVLIPAASFMLYYNYRTTGHPLLMPYAAHEAMYAVAPPFLFQPPRPEPPYRHREMRRLFVDFALGTYLEQQPPGGVWNGVAEKLRTILGAFFLTTWGMVSIPLWPLVWRRNPMVKALFAVTAGCVLAFMPETWLWPHYVAPVMGLFLVIIMLGLRRLYVWRPGGRPLGAWCVLAFSLLSLASILGTANALHVEADNWAVRRATLVGQLERAGGRHLVVVRYEPAHSVHDEWVHNGADIDGSVVVWAREMDETSNRRLFDYFRDRRIWLVEADKSAPHLTPYAPLSSR